VTGRQTDRQIDGRTVCRTDRQTHRQTDTQIERIPTNLKELKVLQFLLQRHADLLEVLLSSLHGLVRLQCGRFKSMQLQGCYENGKKEKKEVFKTFSVTIKCLPDEAISSIKYHKLTGMLHKNQKRHWKIRSPKSFEKHRNFAISIRT
jgi:hypothetical protein